MGFFGSLFGFGSKVAGKEHQQAPAQGLTPAPTPEEKRTPVVRETAGRRSNYMSILRDRRLKARRARQARRITRRGSSRRNPKNLQMMPVRLVA